MKTNRKLKELWWRWTEQRRKKKLDNYVYYLTKRRGKLTEIGQILLVSFCIFLFTVQKQKIISQQDQLI